jgi:hypothetical protein
MEPYILIEIVTLPAKAGKFQPLDTGAEAGIGIPLRKGS